MNLVEQTVKKFLEDYKLDKFDVPYLVAFSGGFDSMCLLNCLKNISNNRIIAIHLNHNWRGDESDIEEKNCKNFCKRIGVEFYSEKLPDGISCTETEARNYRYDFFEKCAKKFCSEIIFTAHNKNDNAETLLYRMAKGTGIVGLQGISPTRGLYYRPLLSTDRTTIEQYCNDYGLAPNNDSSNADNIHKRNLIRNEVLPKLKEINKNVIDSLNSLSQNATEEEQIINEYIEIIKGRICANDEYTTREFLKLSEPVQMRLIYNLVTPLVPQDYDRKRVKILYNFIHENYTSKSGKMCSVTSDYELFVSENHIKLLKKYHNEKISIKINQSGEYKNGRITVNICECNRMPDKTDKLSGGIVYVDLSAVDFDFELRNRNDGDIIQPLGMNGHQKLKKYLNSKKIPNYQKDELLFLAQGNEILWAINLGLSDKIKVKNKPTHKIEVKINGN
ncbi:tRNA lysidine(34) synthetase TilS [bacterium]|nr:tRNA lysidine(34) synthetase TilS [bacterium]